MEIDVESRRWKEEIRCRQWGGWEERGVCDDAEIAEEEYGAESEPVRYEEGYHVSAERSALVDQQQGDFADVYEADG